MMMTKIVSRGEWGARPARRPVKSHGGKLAGVCWHWSGRVNENEKKIPQINRMRNMQSFHINHPTVKYLDIAYNYLIGVDGKIYEGRGLEARSGGEGRLKLSFRGKRYLSVCFNVGLKPSGIELKPNRNMYDAALDLREWIDTQYPDLKGRDVCHGDIRHGGKNCPGPTVSHWVKHIMPQQISKHNMWYQDALKAAIELGITDGSDPQKPATRAEVAIMAMRAAEALAPSQPRRY